MFMDDLRILSMVQNFPIGDPARNREELLSKAAIISYLAATQDQFMSAPSQDIESTVRNYFEDFLGVDKSELMPSVSIAERNLHLSSGFVQDYGKVQLIKENNPGFDAMFDALASSIDLSNEQTKSM
jgi:hypothetical protein